MTTVSDKKGKPMKHVLFILKKRKIYSEESSNTFSSGLYNSAKFVNDMLNTIPNIISHIVEVTDNNDIDRVVTEYKPTDVIIEALWVVPEKFEVLKHLHPNVNFIVRLHSEIPFLSTEGVAMDWLYRYEEQNIKIAFNSKRTVRDFKRLGFKNVIYLPNYYPVDFNNKKIKTAFKTFIDIGCFGSIRPMKNQLLQAIASIRFADLLNEYNIHFHINSGRVEQKGENVLKNIRELFKNNPQHRLIEHGWYTHDEFIEQIRDMDINLQDSLSESFNIVTADAVNNNIPVVTSNQVTWVNRLFRVKDNTSVEQLVDKLFIAYYLRNFNLQYLNKLNLYFYGLKSIKEWRNNF